jgi:gamma-glutamyl-gamma-aminobutyrate hydrolase PuuD
MRLIGVTQRVVVDPAHGERRDALDQRWPSFLAAGGFAGIPLPNHPALALELAAGAGLKGLLLTGGNDLASYGGDAPERDAAEKALLAWARERGLPTLGVCRGMQMIQDSFGVGLKHAEGHVTHAHPVLIDGRERSVNSYHRFHATETVPELHVWARGWDGSVEAIRHAREPILGVMWHPERNRPFDERDLTLFAEFFQSRR